MALPILFDTDIGTDIDDAYALALILCAPELELQGVTVVNNDTQARAKLALKMLYEAGRADVPVAMGRPTQTGGSVNQAPWAQDFSATAPIAQPAAEFIVEKVNAAPGELTLIAVGPFTNLADALLVDPDLGQKLKSLIIMGGCIGAPEGATPEIRPEYNVLTDVPAAQKLLSCGAPLIMTPLDATCFVKLEAENRVRLLQGGTPLTNALAAMLALWPGQTPILHDPLAVGLAIEETICELTPMHIVCDDEGYTRPQEGAPNVLVALRPDVARFLHLFMERLSKGTPSC